MKPIMSLIAAGSLFLLTGCCSVHSAKWEYQTVCVPVGNSGFKLDQTNGMSYSNDQALNGLVRQGWKVAGFSMTEGTQYYLLKRRTQ